MNVSGKLFLNSNPCFSIVIPTYNRRDVVLDAVRALERQSYKNSFEVIVVVDGSNDGSAEALRELKTSFPFTVLEQPNQGASTARNQGAALAKGEIILFLDDDMEAHPNLIAEHNYSFQKGTDAVIGHIPLHPESPANFLSKGVEAWAENRVNELVKCDGQIPFHEFMTGQLSINREVFLDMGGFDTNFTEGGSFGNEDLDFGLRLQGEGYRIAFNLNAISWQKYVVTPRQYLRQWRQAGQADVLLVRKYPEKVDEVFNHQRIRPQSSKKHFLWKYFRWFIRWVILAIVDLNLSHNTIAKLFFALRDLEYWQGVRDAGGIPKCDSLRVLCYHSISDLRSTPVLESYGIPPSRFGRQLDLLKKLGFHFISPNEFLRFLQGESGLPKRSVLLTFDDCYQDNLDYALPILEQRRIPAIAFAVTGQIGGTNEWDKSIGAPSLKLLDKDGLIKLSKTGIMIGSHSRSHKMLNRVDIKELHSEVHGSVLDLTKIGLKPDFFAYPYGEYDEVVKKAIQEVGFKAAFTIKPGFVRSKHNFYEIPRIEVLKEHVDLWFLWKVFRAK